jgi:hypothetical protein
MAKLLEGLEGDEETDRRGWAGGAVLPPGRGAEPILANVKVAVALRGSPGPGMLAIPTSALLGSATVK